MDQRRRIRFVDLDAQAPYGDIDDVGVAVEIHVPHLRCNQRARQHFGLAFGHQVQQGKFLGGEVDAFAVARDAPFHDVDFHVGDVQQVGFADRSAPQQGADPGHQFGKCKRFHQVVVGAQLQALDAVVDFVARGQEQHRRRMGLAQFADHLPAIHAGQHDVQHDQVIVFGGGAVQAVGAGPDPVDHIT